MGTTLSFPSTVTKLLTGHKLKYYMGRTTERTTQSRKPKRNTRRRWQLQRISEKLCLIRGRPAGIKISAESTRAVTVVRHKRIKSGSIVKSDNNTHSEAMRWVTSANVTKGKHEKRGEMENGKLRDFGKRIRTANCRYDNEIDLFLLMN